MTEKQELKTKRILKEIVRVAKDQSGLWGNFNQFSITMSLREYLEITELLKELDEKPLEAPNTTLTKEQMRQQEDLSEQRE